MQLLLERQPLVLESAVVLPCPLLRNQDNSLPADLPRIVLAHGGVHGFGGRDYEGDEEAQAGANNLIGLGALPAEQIDYFALGDWHNLKVRLSGDGDLDRFELSLEAITAGRVARDLLRLEVSGSLSLAGHRRYHQLSDDLQNRLLRLRIKGEYQQAPEAAELEQLTARSEDPLIAQVAQQLQHRLNRESDPDSDEASRIRTALCELFHFATNH